MALPCHTCFKPPRSPHLPCARQLGFASVQAHRMRAWRRSCWGTARRCSKRTSAGSATWSGTCASMATAPSSPRTAARPGRPARRRSPPRAPRPQTLAGRARACMQRVCMFLAFVMRMQWAWEGNMVQVESKRARARSAEIILTLVMQVGMCCACLVTSSAGSPYCDEPQRAGHLRLCATAQASPDTRLCRGAAERCRGWFSGEWPGEVRRRRPSAGPLPDAWCGHARPVKTRVTFEHMGEPQQLLAVLSLGYWRADLAQLWPPPIALR